MKIIIMTHTIPRFSGDPSAPFMEILANSFVKLGHKVTVLAPYDQRINFFEKRRYKLVTYKYIFPNSLHLLGYSRTLKGDKSISLMTYFLSPFFYFFGFIALLKLAKKEKPEIISTHWIIPNGFIAALVSKIAKIPFTTTIPGSDVYLAGQNPMFKAMAAFASKNAGVVISDSAHYLDQLKNLGANPRNKVVIRYGVDMDRLKPSKKDKRIMSNLGITERDKIILAVGRMVSKKGFIYLVRAFPEILKKVLEVKLVLVGDGQETERLKREVEKLGIRGKVIFPGMISYNDLSKYYNLADVFVMPSIKDEKGNIDASPVSMMEAMAVGTPVVTTRFGGNKDLIKPGITGYLVKEKNSEEIAEAVVMLLKKKLANGVKKTVRETATENFSADVISKKYTKCFQTAILEASSHGLPKKR